MAHILVVEDEPGIAMALEDDLALEGHRVALATDGIEASRLARSLPFDLILLDIMLPGKDGFDVCREIRRAGLTVPILMLTARVQETEKVLGLDLGADDYITKPYSHHELRARIRALLRRASVAPAQKHSFGDVEVDLVRAEARRAGRVVELTPLEFKLLAAFLQSPGRLLTRQLLLDAAWGKDVYVTERAVDNQVMNLRRKLEDDHTNPRFFSSVRGLGYRFDAGGVTDS
ncbi:MAG: response regulator transcription factor [Acidobacteria bacterium]|nr:response regulator transcription factor [Acidobacteriota bacterium]